MKKTCLVYIEQKKTNTLWKGAGSETKAQAQPENPGCGEKN